MALNKFIIIIIIIIIIITIINFSYVMWKPPTDLNASKVTKGPLWMQTGISSWPCPW